MEIGQLIKKYREEHNLSLREFADRCGLSHAYIAKLEEGKDPRTGKKIEPTLDTVKKVSDALNMPLNKLLKLLGYIDTAKEITFGQVIRKLREEKDWTVSHAAKILGITEDELSRYENDELIPDAEMLNKFAEAYADAANYKSPTKFAERIKKFLLSEEGSIEINLTNMFNLLSVLSGSGSIIYGHTMYKNKRVPILGTIKAGLPILAEEHWEGEIEVPEYIGGDFALRVEGDSMIYAGIFPGDLAILKSSSIAQHGQVVAAGVEEEAWRANLKFFVKTNGKTLLRSANPDYKDIEFTPRHRIIGVLAGLIREESPTLNTYLQMLITKEMLQETWMDVIQAAMNNGLSPEQVKQLIEIQGTIARKMIERD